MKRACLFRSLCTQPVKKKAGARNPSKTLENQHFLLGKKKEPPETEHSVPEIIKTIGKSSKSPQLAPPRKWSCSNTPQWGTSESIRIPCKNQWKTSIPQGRGVSAPVCYGAPRAHEHSVAKTFKNLVKTMDPACRHATFRHRELHLLHERWDAPYRGGAGKA